MTKKDMIKGILKVAVNEDFTFHEDSAPGPEENVQVRNGRSSVARSRYIDGKEVPGASDALTHNYGITRISHPDDGGGIVSTSTYDEDYIPVQGFWKNFGNALGITDFKPKRREILRKTLSSFNSDGTPKMVVSSRDGTEGRGDAGAFYTDGAPVFDGDNKSPQTQGYLRRLASYWSPNDDVKINGATR